MSNKDCLSALLALEGPRVALTLVEGRAQTHQWSCAELQRQRQYVERVLLTFGMHKGDRLLVSTANSPYFFAIMLASVALELCLMPLHGDFSRQQLLALMQAQPPRMVIVDASHNPAARCHTNVLQVHEQQLEWLQPLTVCAPPDSGLAADLSAQNSDPALMLFHSSGSTGQPKGMLYTRSMLNNYLGKLHELYAAFPDQPRRDQASDRVNVLPLTHFGGLSFCLLALLEARTLHLLRSRDARDHLALLRQQQCQLLLVVPSLLQELLTEYAEATLPDLRHCLAMGESISQSQLQLLSQRLGLPVHNAYGMSECLTGIYNSAAAAPAPMGSCGLLHFGEARLQAPNGLEHPSEGELWVRNITTVPCYTDAALNHRKYRDGWYHTGDLFRRDAAGHYFFVSRADLMCVINGRNVYPQEVEQVLCTHPAIARCIVAPIRLADGRQRLAAAIELLPAANLSANELMDFYLQRGAIYATPAWVQFFASLPRNAGDKADRRHCQCCLQHSYDHARASLPAGATA